MVVSTICLFETMMCLFPQQGRWLLVFWIHLVFCLCIACCVC
uniref:Uncharacterized protein n=1 Tax=Arundo donax TaxID=35708 RepID=A0A0A9AZ87_ARUDO